MAVLLVPLGLLMNANHRIDLPIPVWLALFLPALLGALVFRADQQQDHRLFLTARAARPRFVWLARHFVWLGAMLLIGVDVQLVLAVLVGSLV